MRIDRRDRNVRPGKCHVRSTPRWREPAGVARACVGLEWVGISRGNSHLVRAGLLLGDSEGSREVLRASFCGLRARPECGGSLPRPLGRHGGHGRPLPLPFCLRCGCPRAQGRPFLLCRCQRLSEPLALLLEARKRGAKRRRLRPLPSLRGRHGGGVLCGGPCHRLAPGLRCLLPRTRHLSSSLPVQAVADVLPLARRLLGKLSTP